MRIIGGTAAGKILKAPPGLEVRPTPDLVRQALFNSLGARVEGNTVLELFAGTGALSLECLSRGAAQAVCVEKSPRHARFIRQNLELMPFPPSLLEIRTQDAFSAIQQLAQANRTFDLILADPPYGEKNIGRRSTSFAQRLLDDPVMAKLLSPEGIFILGHARRDTLTIPVGWVEEKILKHGDSHIRFFKNHGL